ncbi:MAG: hypothetical protein JOZ52_06645 [Acidobacteria bacterium]|nr:hypothetical protein [Acidobacteriota bacterium]
MGFMFEDIGFPLESGLSYMNLLHEMVEHGEIIRTESDAYVWWSPDKAIAVSAKIKEEGELGMLRPHFIGESTTTVALVEKFAYQDAKMADGLFVAYGNPQKSDGEFVSKHKSLHYGDGTYSSYLPFIFDAPDYERYADLILPALIDIKLTGFALHLYAFESEDDWVDYQLEYDTSGEEDPYIWTGKAFVPEAMLDKREDPTRYARPKAFLAGIALDTAILTNPLTGCDFCWARLETAIGEIEVVASPSILDGYFVTDGVIAGDFYLSGHIVGEPDI